MFPAQINPGHSLGSLILGASLHETLTRLKAEPNEFPKINLIFEQSSPLTEPVILSLPCNGLRLRFDGPEQRLCLIEVVEFSKCQLRYKEKEVLRNLAAEGLDSSKLDSQPGPSFRHIYNRLLGPTFPGEFVETTSEDEYKMGTYVLSYPGIAFSFPLSKSVWSQDKDCVSLLSTSSNCCASSMAIFHGKSWSDARNSLYTNKLEVRDKLPMPSKNRELVRDEFKLVRIHGEGQIELLRLEGMPSFWIKLGLTSPQDLIANLGPPDAIYKKNDQKMSIHKSPVSANGWVKEKNLRNHDDLADTDQSSGYTVTDDSDSEESMDEPVENISGECFYNYFYHGFDILLSTTTVPSLCPPSKASTLFKSKCENIIPSDLSNRLVTTKLILHGNVPGSYSFNRHRRCRWEIQYLSLGENQDTVNSESPFHVIEKRLQKEWKSMYRNGEEEELQQRGMVLNRDWGDSLGSSCELLGGWEENIKYTKIDYLGSEDTTSLSNTTLYGFPGLVFEVMMNGSISGLTVF